MKVNLLYADKDWVNTKSYYEWNSIVQDLNLNVIFHMAKSDLVMRHGKVMYVGREDDFLADCLKKVMQVPLTTRREMLFRQEVLKDCLVHVGFVDELYHLVSDVLEGWNKLGRKKHGSGIRDTKAGLIMEIRVFELLLSGMLNVKNLIGENVERLSSRGFKGLYERMMEEFPQERQEGLEKILQDLTFYVDTTMRPVERNTFKSYVPRIIMECELYDGLKFGNMKLLELETIIKTYSNPNGILARLQGQLGTLSPDTISTYRDTALQDNAAEIEFQAVNYVMACCKEMIYSMGQFFDQLHFQIGFYRAAINIKSKMQRYGMEYCIPEIGPENALHFDDLKEMVMCVEQGSEIVGNSENMDGKSLAIITGANQGGKSTFLRSIGIAQVMMQCGLMVPAKQYCSNLYPEFFTHFTRREDSAMNSGRLDEELKRMDRIINHVGKHSLILLNESFATTTEKEGSVIAYDIIKALKEEGIRILTVTHLLSFAKKIYKEESVNSKSDVAFLSAEHLPDGTRTFKMISHEPELTSFGLELYEKVIGATRT